MKETTFYPELRKQIFSVFARVLPIEEFEQWLYEQEYLVEYIEKEELIFELLAYNYKNRDTYYLEQFENFFSDFFSKDEIGYHVSLILSYNIANDNEGWLQSLMILRDWADEYEFLKVPTGLCSFMDETDAIYYDQVVVITQILAMQLVISLERFGYSEETGLTDFNFESNNEELQMMYETISNTASEHKKVKPWWQFWK